MNEKVYVANLLSQASKAELHALFSNAGGVMSVKIVQDCQGQANWPTEGSCLRRDINTIQWEVRRAVCMLNRTDFMGNNCWWSPMDKVCGS
jgi:hypothetical protein